MSRRRFSRTTIAVFVAAVFALPLSLGNAASASVGAEASAPQQAAGPAVGIPVLHLNNGDFAAGNLVDCDDPKLLRWQCPAAVEPFDFLFSSVSGVYFPPSTEPDKAAGEFCVELAGGDLVFGSIVSISNSEVVVQSPRLGTLHIDRKNVLRLVRLKDSTGIVYAGPHGLTDWEQSSGQADWREEAGEIVTDRSGAAIFSNIALPPQASIDIDLSWKTKADFLLALGTRRTDETPPAAGQRPGTGALGYPYSIFTVNFSLVACRESADDADIADLQLVKSGPGHVHLRVFLDQTRGRMSVYADNGRLLADLSAPDLKPHTEAGIRLINNQGDLRLERLRVNRWNETAPRDASSGTLHLMKSDGEAVDGEVQDFDAVHRQFILHGYRGETRVDADKVDSILVAHGSDAPPTAAMRVSMNDGACLSGKLEKVSNHQLALRCAGIDELIVVPLANLQSIVVFNHEPINLEEAGRTGRLELEGVRLKGCLTESRNPAVADASCLVWRPQSSPTGSTLRNDITGRIVYRDPPAAAPKNANQAVAGQMQGGRIVINNGGVLVVQGQQIQGPVVLNAVVGALSDQAARPAAAATSFTGPAIYLRAGDVIPCRVTGVTEEGVQFQSSITDAKFVPHSHIKAVELASVAAPRSLDRDRRERLLTLPRMQRENPPTQLVVSTNGDYLRGRLNQMDDKKLTMEIQLESRQLARNRVAKIIWFHPDELQDAAKPVEEPVTTGGLRVQAQRNDGVRLTFSPMQMNNASLSGASDVLGPCRVDLMQVDQLLLGSAIEQGAARNVYGKWKLHHAKEPIFAQDNSQDGTNPNAGTQSALVGKPAPDFELKLLDGGKFRLRDHKGEVVVVDFWATWCGPCVNAMPQVDQAVEELKDQKVKLVAVNMQEDPKAIHALLERLNLKPEVALDQDGTTAEKYAVTAIPQTVIIDADGSIARLFVGGGPNFGEQLSAALKDVLAKRAGVEEAVAKPDKVK